MKPFGSKKIKLHAGVKKCHFGNILITLGSYDFLAILEGKIGVTPFF
jgi:hypothetical protein